VIRGREGTLVGPDAEAFTIDPMPMLLGLEEEFFLIEAGALLPTLQSLDYLRKLYWRQPRDGRTRIASNFARGKDRKLCWMSSVEVSTHAQPGVDALIDDLRARRRRVAEASRGALCAPVGTPLGLDAPSNTAGLHLHFGVPAADRDRVYANLGYFLPVLMVASMNSPAYGLPTRAKSYRMACNFASGTLVDDREYRFQDLIVSKRLGTVEIRALDPVPDLGRLRAIVEAAVAIAAHPEPLPFDRERFNAERPHFTVEGLTPWVRDLWERMQPIAPMPIELLEQPESDRILAIAERRSPEEAYLALDAEWRRDTGVPLELREHRKIRAWTGVLGYYVPQLPFMAYKGLKEWYGAPPDLSRPHR